MVTQMAGVLGTLTLTLTLHLPVTGTPYFRRLQQFSAVRRSPISGKNLEEAYFRKSRSVSRARIVAATPQFPNGNSEEESRIPQVRGSIWTKTLVKFAADNFLPLALVSGVALGLANPCLGCLADRYYLSKFSTFGIFIISGLTLRSDEIGVAAQAWPVGLFGLGSILFFTPLFSKIILLLKVQPQEFVTGLAIFTCMPTTLSSGVALTRLAGGNSALALGMTVISNLLGILIIPFSVSKFVAAGVGVSVPTEKLLRSLVLTLLVPLILGKVARESFKGVADFVDGNRKLLAVTSAILLSFILGRDISFASTSAGPEIASCFAIPFMPVLGITVPWIQVSRSRSLLLMVKPTNFFAAIVMGALLHSAILAFNALAIRSISVVSGGSKSVFAKEGNAIALLIVASQKTLPVMVTVVEQLGGALGESGLLVLPCVAAHLNQIIIDSFLINFWRKNEDPLANARVA